MQANEKLSATNLLVRRWISYCIGLFLVALAISCSVKSGLGISPASSMAYVAGLANGWSMGTWTAIFYTSFVVLQIILKGRAFELKNLLQVPVSMAFGVVVDFTNFLFSFAPDPTNYSAQLGYLGLSLIIMGFGYVY